MDGDPLSLLDVDSRRVVARPASGLGVFVAEAFAASPDQRVNEVFSGGGVLVGFNTRTMQVEWLEPLGTERMSRFGGQAVYGNFALSYSFGGDRILVADSDSGGVLGIAALDARSRDAVGFIGPLRARFLLPVAAGVLAPIGGILALGTRAGGSIVEESDRRSGKFYFLAGSPVGIRDSISFLSPEDSAAGGVASIATSADGRFVLFSTFRRILYKYELSGRRYVGQLALPAVGPLTTSARSGVVYVLDGSVSRDSPGSGQMYVVDPDLTSFTTVDLRAAGYDGVAPVLTAIAADSISGAIYVGTGTAARGPLFGPQAGKVVVFDERSRMIASVIEIERWGIKSIRFR